VIGNLTAKLPIVQGGMGIGISLSGLASAIANEGGIGVISSVGVGLFEKDSSTQFMVATKRALEREIRIAKEKSNGILGVNAMVALTDFEELVRISIAADIDIVFAGAGLPLNLPALRDENKPTKFVPIVSSGRAAALLCKVWKEKHNYLPDAIVLEGPKAGGHLGFSREQLDNPEYDLEILMRSVKDNVRPFEEKYNQKIPLIVAGGIYDGADIHKFLSLGADGVQMSTRFVTTHECDASIDFKNTYVNAKVEDVGIISSPVGMPGRAIWNDFLDKVRRGEKHPINCHYHCLKTCDYKTAPYCILQALLSAAKGKMEMGFAFAGINAFKSNKIVSVHESVEELLMEYQQAKDSSKN